MSTQPHPRQPSGVPTGGQFTTTGRTETGTQLDSQATVVAATTNILDTPIEYFGEFAEKYDLEAIRSDYQKAINEVLPDGVFLDGAGQVHSSEADADLVRRFDFTNFEGEFFDMIVARHELPTS